MNLTNDIKGNLYIDESLLVSNEIVFSNGITSFSIDNYITTKTSGVHPLTGINYSFELQDEGISYVIRKFNGNDYISIKNGNYNLPENSLDYFNNKTRLEEYTTKKVLLSPIGWIVSFKSVFKSIGKPIEF